MDCADMIKDISHEMRSRWLTPEGIISIADKNGDGRIELTEFANVIDQLGMKMSSDSLLLDFFSSIDSDKNGVIDKVELLKLFCENEVKLVHDFKENKKQNQIVSEENRTDKFIALVAHNQMKSILMNFVLENRSFFNKMPLVTTGSTGRSLQDKLGISVHLLVASGPLGGDQAIGGMISEANIAAIFFFKDPLTSHPHSSDIEALTRLCDVHQIPYATNAASAVGLILSIEKYGIDWSLKASESDVVINYKKKQSQIVSSFKDSNL